MKRTRELIDELESQLKEDVFNSFIELFRKSNGKLPQPIQNIINLNKTHPDKIYIVLNDKHYLELHIKRRLLIQSGLELRELQNFERSLRNMKPRLTVIQSTHKVAVESKIYQVG